MRARESSSPTSQTPLTALPTVKREAVDAFRLDDAIDEPGRFAEDLLFSAIDDEL